MYAGPLFLGIALAAVGGYMITKHAPKPPKPVPVAEQANSDSAKSG